MVRNIKGLGTALAVGLSLSLAACGDSTATLPMGQPDNSAPAAVEGKGVPPVNERLGLREQKDMDTLKVDLRQTPLANMDAAQKAALSTAEQVEVTLPNGESFAYQNTDGVMLLEGDIAISPSNNAAAYLANLSQASLSSQGLEGQGLSRFAPGRANWSNNTIPYYWRSGTYSAEQERIMRASINRWNEQAGDAVRWVWDTSARNGIEFIRGGSGSCGWSYVGSIGGRQQLAISCFNTHTIIHEMGHAAGLWHEHQRCDRNNFVSIPASYLNDSVNFGKNCNIYSYGPYDYDSIMNYGNPFVYAVSNPAGSYTGSPRNLGKLPDLSAGDVSALRMTYLGKDNGGTNPTPSPAPTPTPTPDTNYKNTYSGFLYAGQYAVIPNGGYFNATGAGKVEGKLTGPSSADLELYLQGWTANGWQYIAASELSGSNENISYNATSGSFRWVVYAYSGSGNFTLQDRY